MFTVAIVMAQYEICKFGRKGLIATFSPTFVFPDNQKVMESCQKQNENDWESPIALESFSGIKINISGSGSGTAANIEATKFDGVYLRSMAALSDFYTMTNEDQDNANSRYYALLETKLSYLPQAFSQYRGKTAKEIASQVSYQDCQTIANNFNCTGKYAANNQKQKDAILMASALYAVKAQAGDVFFKSFAANPSATMANVPQSSSLYNFVAYIEQNWPGLIAEFSGMGSEPDGVSSSSVVVYDCPTKTPNIRKVDKQGFTKVYSFKIVIDKTRKNPVHVEIHEGKGRPQTNHQVGIVSGSYQKVCDKVFDFTADEWIYALNMCKSFRDATVVNEYRRIVGNAEMQRRTSMERGKQSAGQTMTPYGPASAANNAATMPIQAAPQQQYYNNATMGANNIYTMPSQPQYA